MIRRPVGFALKSEFDIAEIHPNGSKLYLALQPAIVMNTVDSMVDLERLQNLMQKIPQTFLRMVDL